MRRRPPVASAEAIVTARTGVPTVDQDSRIYPPPKEPPVSRHTLAVALLCVGLVLFVIAALSAFEGDVAVNEVGFGFLGFAATTAGLIAERVK